MTVAASATELWAASQSRSFYNSPAFAEFSSTQGNSITYVSLETADSGAAIPVARPHVWTNWRQTRVPIPRQLAASHSIYYGIVIPARDQAPDFIAYVKNIVARSESTFFPRFDFVQPALLDSGPAHFLDEFVEAIASTGIEHAETSTRILHLGAGAIDSSWKQLNELTDEQMTSAPHYAHLVAQYEGKRRYDIRRAKRLGVTVQVSRITTDIQALEVYSSIIELHRESWTRTGLGPHTLDYWVRFSHAVRESGGQDIVSRAYSESGELVGVNVVHALGKSALYQMNSSSELGKSLSANPLCLHAAITACALWGIEYFELGRSSAVETEKSRSVAEYKKQFGGDDYPVPNLSITPSGKVMSVLSKIIR